MVAADGVDGVTDPGASDPIRQVDGRIRRAASRSGYGRGGSADRASSA